MGWLASKFTFLNAEELLTLENNPSAAEPREAAAAETPKSIYGPYDFALTTIDGAPVKLSDYQGKVVLVNFWATWCGPCVVETPSLVRVYHKYRDRGFQVIGVAMQSEEDNVKKFVDKYHVPYAIARDTTSEIGLRYQVFALPSSFLFTPEGKVKKTFMGFVEEATLERELESLLTTSPTQAEGVSYRPKIDRPRR